MDSISAIIVEPVVEKPEIVSKKAFVKFGIAPLITYGKLPKIEKTTHTDVTIT